MSFTKKVNQLIVTLNDFDYYILGKLTFNPY
jgi:hypothetical protein